MLSRRRRPCSEGRRLGDRFRERLRLSSWCLTSTDSATTERAPPGPASRATVASRCRNRTARSRTAGSYQYRDTGKNAREIWNSPCTGVRQRIVRRLFRASGRLQPEQHAQALAHVRDDVSGRLGLEDRPTDVPIQVLYVVGEDSADYLAPRRQRHLEWVTLDLTRDRAGDCQARLRIVGTRRQDERWTPASLLVPSMRIEG